MHRDIKPENVIVHADGSATLIDFGLSTSSEKSVCSMAGTPYYIAPEVVDSAYRERCDIWSLGVLAYVLLTGFLPFSGDSRREILKYEKFKSLCFHENHNLSEEAIDLVTKMLRKVLALRPTAEACLEHQFFRGSLKTVCISRRGNYIR